MFFIYPGGDGWETSLALPGWIDLALFLPSQG